MAHYFTNDNNKIENLTRVNASINDTSYYFYTDNGVFSKGELDYGTELLLKTFEYSNPLKTILDIGCGCGAIGIYLAKLGFTVDMCDVNLKAIELSKKAIVEQKLKANVYESDAYLNVNNKYDYIISNPPIRVGKKKLYEIVMGAKENLNENGEVWLVVRKDKGADSLVKDMKNIYSKVYVIEKKKGFHIIKACK